MSASGDMRAPAALLLSLVPIVLGIAVAAATPSRDGEEDAPAGDVPREDGSELIGKPAPSWKELRWLEREPLELESLRGKTVLVRWWTRGCSYCVASAPVIEALHEKYRERGLVVVGVYHPKPRPRPVEDGEVARSAKKLGLRFPIAIDAHWKALRRWWLDVPGRRFTSVSFLIDRAGRIRWVHPGGEYHPSDDPEHAACDASYRELMKLVPELLAEGDERQEDGEAAEEAARE